MALIINNKDEFKYTPFEEREAEKPFSVTFKRLNVRTLANIEDNFVQLRGENSISLQQGSYNYNAIKAALVSWENLTDGKKQYKLETNKRGEVLDSSLDLLPANIMTEIATVIINVAKDPSKATDFGAEAV